MNELSPAIRQPGWSLYIENNQNQQGQEAPGFVPRGFANREAFEAFGDTLYRGFRGAGWTDVELYLRGSAVTGYRWRDGRPFDERGERSDLDIAVVSRELFERAEQLGQVNNSKWSAPMGSQRLAPYNLDPLREALAAEVSRRFSFMFYRDRHSMINRNQPYIYMKRKN